MLEVDTQGPFSCLFNLDFFLPPFDLCGCLQLRSGGPRMGLKVIIGYITITEARLDYIDPDSES